MQASARIWRHFDTWLLGAVGVLTIAGVALIRAGVAGTPELIELNVVGRQAVYGLVSLVVLFAPATIDFRLWAALSRLLYGFMVLMLGLIPIAGVAGFGAARWFEVATLTVQPSELAKILTILVLADYLGRNRPETLGTLLKSFALVGLPALLILGQPDLSTAVVLLVIWLAMVWAAGARLRYLVIILGLIALAALLVAPLLAQYLLEGYPQGEDFLFVRNYQMTRVINFLFPHPEESF